VVLVLATCGAAQAQGEEDSSTSSAPSTQSPLFRATLSGAYSHGINRHLGAARLELDIGADLEAPVSIAGRFGVEAGALASGFAYQRVAWGMSVAVRAGPRVRLGLGPRLGMFILSGNSRTQRQIAGSVGGQVELSIALIGAGTRRERHRSGRKDGALDLVLGCAYEWIDVTQARRGAQHSVSPSVGLGWRI